MVRNVIFDLDGTLIDTSLGIVESIQHTVKQMGFAELSHEDLISFVGPPLQKSFMLKCSCDKNAAQKATDIFREYYSKGAMFKAMPYEDIVDVCEKLKKMGIRLAVATNKREDLALEILSYFRLDKFFHSIHGSDDSGKLNKSSIIKLCIAEMGNSADYSVVVGDTAGDEKSAKETGCKFLAVTWGFGFDKTKEATANIIGMAHEPKEILDILFEQNRENAINQDV